MSTSLEEDLEVSKFFFMSTSCLWQKIMGVLQIHFFLVNVCKKRTSEDIQMHFLAFQCLKEGIVEDCKV